MEVNNGCLTYPLFTFDFLTLTTVNELIFARLHSVALMVHFRVASEGGVFVSARSAVFVFGSAAKAVGLDELMRVE